MRRLRRPPAVRRAQAGATLLQLMVTVIIIGILATVAVRSLSKTRLRATRQDAANCLTQAADRQEAYYLRNNGYATTIAQLGMTASCGNDGAYTLATMACGSGLVAPFTDPCYGFQASPNTATRAGLAQAGDGTLKLEVHYTQKRPDLRLVKSRQPVTGAAISNWQ